MGDAIENTIIARGEKETIPVARAGKILAKPQAKL